MKSAHLVTTRLTGWEGSPVSLTNLPLLRCRHKLWEDSEGAARCSLNVRIDPRSFDEGLKWHGDEGTTAFEMHLDVDAGKISGIRFMAEFCTCGGHAVGGRAPAWIFPSNPLDEVSPERIPAAARRRMNCVLGLLAGGADLESLRAWHAKTETGWRLE